MFDIREAREIEREHFASRFKQSGLSLTLVGVTVTAAQTAVRMVEASTETGSETNGVG